MVMYNWIQHERDLIDCHAEWLMARRRIMHLCFNLHITSFGDHNLHIPYYALLKNRGYLTQLSFLSNNMLSFHPRPAQKVINAFVWLD